MIKQILYTSCTELPLYNFIKILVHADYSYLIKKNGIIKANPEDVWSDIFSEYITLANDSQQNYLLSLLKDITVLSNKITIIQSIVDQLAINYHKDLADQLRAFGFRYKYDPSDEDQYFKDLRLTVTQSKSMALKIEQRKTELDKLNNSGNKVTESEYDNLLFELGKFQGFPFRAKENTVSQFIVCFNAYKKANEVKSGK